MRWDSLMPDDAGRQAGQPLTLFDRAEVARTFDTPGFRGITFHEVHARSIISKVPESSRVPFRWTINPYRGCSHACVYCFARNTHTYLDFDSGHDFDTQVVVKVNAPELLRRELRAPRWSGEHIAMGTNVDCYQRAEGKYRLMPGIITALTEAANPFSILTKGTLILRDIDLLARAAEVTDVGLNVSVGFVDKSLSRSAEPGTPSPERRLAACAALAERGLRCGVLMGPILPFLSDAPEQLEETVAKIAAAGAAHVTPIVLHLRPGAREWYQRWLRENHPELGDAYRELYGSRAYAPKSYQQSIGEHVAALARKYGVGRTSPAGARRLPAPNSQPAPDNQAAPDSQTEPAARDGQAARPGRTPTGSASTAGRLTAPRRGRRWPPGLGPEPEIPPPAGDVQLSLL
ncbi:MAG TPA: Rv2578c family radical SAM protein [Streptosporangiaceae bacterium]|jgi:DNA repair photolyase